MALAYSILHDREQASDAVQDTAEQACRSWGTLRQRDRRTAWLSTICVRQAMRRARTERRQLLLPWRQRPEQSRDVDVTDVDLERALRQLSVRQRAVVGLHHVYGYSLDEAAAILGCRPGTARSHLSRALGTLRAMLEGDSPWSR
jgi:RNA polymerase sigma-70 factor (ECF subfamily)